MSRLSSSRTPGVLPRGTRQNMPPREQKAVKTAADTFRPNPEFNCAEVITQLGTGFNWLGSSAAVSNTRLDQLADGTAPFQNLKDDIAYGYSLSQSLGRSYVFRAFSWMQSVSDYSAGTVAA